LSVIEPQRSLLKTITKSEIGLFVNLLPHRILCVYFISQ